MMHKQPLAAGDCWDWSVWGGSSQGSGTAVLQPSGIAQNALTVLYIAESGLQYVDPTWRVAEARKAAHLKGFDVAWLAETERTVLRRSYFFCLVSDDRHFFPS